MCRISVEYWPLIVIHHADWTCTARIVHSKKKKVLETIIDVIIMYILVFYFTD